jgi:hypothetical protein
MAQLSGPDARLVARMERNDRPTFVWACVLMLAGSAYAGWGLLRFDARADTEEHMSFDRPVSSLGRLYGPYAPLLRVVKPHTEVESMLFVSLKHNMAFSVGIMMTLMRVFLGILMIVMGMVALSVRLERRRLLDVIARMGVP